MSQEDRQKWDAKHALAGDGPGEPSRLLTSLQEVLPRTGRALDIAGGRGRHAIWLAQRGLEVTIADISRLGLDLAQRGAAEAGVSIHTQCIDLDSEPLPVGPWDVILSVCFLWRPLFAEIPKVLAPDGWLVVIQPTLRNLERHDKPPAQFLLQENELPSLIQGLEVVRYEEGWLADGRHDAFLVARRLIGNVKTPIR